jgi:hypothetical protein
MTMTAEMVGMRRIAPMNSVDSTNSLVRTKDVYHESMFVMGMMTVEINQMREVVHVTTSHSSCVTIHSVALTKSTSVMENLIVVKVTTLMKRIVRASHHIVQLVLNSRVTMVFVFIII